MQRLWTMMMRYRRRWLYGLLLLVLTNACMVSLPQIFAKAVDAMMAQRHHAVWPLTLWMIAIAVVAALLRTSSRVYLFYAARDVERDLRNRYYSHLVRMGPSFYAQHQTGDLMSRATHDLGQVRLLMGPGVLNLVNTSLAYLATIPLMAYISWRITLVILCIIPVAGFVIQRMGKLLYFRNLAQQQNVGKLSANVEQHLRGAHVIRAYGVEQTQQRHFEQCNQTLYDAGIRLAWVRSAMFRLIMVFAGITVLLAVALGARGVFDGRVTLGQVVAMAEYMMMLAWPTFALGWMVSMWQRGRVSWGRLQEILDAKIDEKYLLPTQGGKTLDAALSLRELSVTLENVRVLDNVSIDVPAATSVGLVGPIGSGKSVLMRSLLQFVPVADGAIFVGGHDLNTLAPAQLRQQFGYVPQDIVLFSRTLRDNVAFGVTACSDDEILKALYDAAFDVADNILPQGLDTQVGERGVTLSGGQKQRVAIARALLIDPQILLLDDALSSVDSETEQAIIERLMKRRIGKTTLIVAHRFSAVRQAHSIYVLDQGRVVQHGTHAQLLADGGLYEAMYARQRFEAEHTPVDAGSHMS